MKLTIDRSKLLKAMSHVQRVVERRTTIPILENVLLTAEASKLIIKGTDLDLEISEIVDVEVDTAGATTVPAIKLYEIVRKLKDGEVKIEYADSKISIKSGRSRFSLKTMPESDFPDLSAGEPTHKFTLSGASLKSLFDKTQFAISTEESRFYLNGVYLHVVDDKLRAVTTDGARLALFEITAPSGSEEMPGVIVPRKTVGEIVKLLDNDDGKVNIELSLSKIKFSIADVVLTSKLIDSTFPDYSRVIPRINDKFLEVDCNDLKQAVERVSAIASDGSRVIKLSMSSGHLDLSVTNADAGTAAEDVDAVYESEPIKVGFNSRYLLDIISQIDGETVVIKSDPKSPALITEKGKDHALYVLMPVTILNR